MASLQDWPTSVGPMIGRDGRARNAVYRAKLALLAILARYEYA
jgi:hypothetical protein